MNEVLEKIQKIGIVPVVVLNDAKDAAPLAKALCDGGLPCAEVTFRTEAAEESIRIMAEQFPQMLVGAGTVLTTEQVDRAVAAGAKFIVSPGLNPKVVKYCIEKGSIALDGISLTIAKLSDDTISVSMIPHTIKNTNFGYKKPGDKINLENDMVGKYIDKLLHFDQQETNDKHTSSTLTMEMLRNAGF